MPKKNGEETEAKPRRQRQKGGFAIFKEVKFDLEGKEYIGLEGLACGLESVIAAEKAIREQGATLSGCKLMIVQIKKEVTVKVETVTKVSF